LRRKIGEENRERGGRGMGIVVDSSSREGESRAGGPKSSTFLERGRGRGEGGYAIPQYLQ
tara:strand:+ start:199 stop:378 length:180 start_codon:yes stop_codon:yes gene_type:complete